MTTSERTAHRARTDGPPRVAMLHAIPPADSLAAVRDRIESMARLAAWRLDVATGEATWSPELDRILGREPDGPAPGGLDDLETALVPGDRALLSDALAAALRGEGVTVECRLAHPGAGETRLRIGAGREVDASGRPVSLLGYVQVVATPPPAGPSDSAPAAAAPSLPPHPAETATRPAARALELGKGVVLLVEDDDTVRMVLGRMLCNLGYSVFEASSGDEALELIGDDDDGIDLVVTDIRMPGISGRELVSRLRDVLRDVPVLFVTGYSADLDDDGRPGRRMGLLAKPFDAAGLTEAIRALVETEAATEARA